MIRLRWTPQPASDLEGVRDYLQENRPELAQPTVMKLYHGVRRLKTTPRLGRPGRVSGTRELVFAPLPYIAVYRLRDEAVEILHIYHGAQDR